MADAAKASMDPVLIVEVCAACALIVLIVGITYPLYVMTDRTRPVLKVDSSSGYVSVATMSLLSSTLYAMMTLITIKFPGPWKAWKVPAAAIVVLLLFFGSCDVVNSIRFQNKMADNEKKYGDVEEANNRANAVAAFFVFEFFIALILLVVAVLPKMAPKSTDPEAP
ncbi:hypothetical protein CTAYLR_005939 [Chrysophaeum taylorii]|uniref:Uncharacterized protein n=1 Tax=Chrysophaeum taylorii TaxID=2483200 RepID=A0AAD7XJ87_9STRA|nr:hypothetical protein CTAYLR_005939 [Chrysophaeum taylorii]